ncbi:TIGR00645 family protein [Shewanella sp. YIC-542]|uniref:TIGR00645 family protein n=1 Tax=Shewanella mytili TaxID=3377111 RepID=UPI00398E8FE0
MSKFERILENWLFRSRWLLAPFFVGLMLAVFALLLKFCKELYFLLAGILSGTPEESIVSILTLVDTALLASLLLIIAFSGYENFVSKMSVDDHEDRPAWMGKVGFSDLKLKLIGAIVAISAVELLKAFVAAGELSHAELGWKVGIHLAFVISGVLFAVTDAIADRPNKH